MSSSGSSSMQQFLILAKSVRGAATVDLVKKVIEFPDIFGFEELLRIENINELKQSEQHVPVYNTLELFAYGTYSDYEANRSKYIQLSAGAKRKLQLLTLASLAVRSRTIPYSVLLNELKINNVRELEDLIIEAIYYDIIHGKLDQLNNRLDVEYCISRDIDSRQSYDHLIKVLDNWCQNCAQILTVLKQETVRANDRKKQTIAEHERFEQNHLSMIKAVQMQQEQSGSGMPGRGGNENNNQSTLSSLSNLMSSATGGGDKHSKKGTKNTAKRSFR
ncbi:unnamed protein product [Didymodactylos carnosus]|uniref:PCI domain-containing protein n=1 Tax=Didymodactylos carnosus TaxID=1234261 RepID=A0A813VBE0_9BILA|nr:unnamed protein product [Didymodactylos carnosus]CAF0835822.1 unnamed protein product [Didymodactylos carnosus]CAF3507324.1 unnamed protein product [Didymodactylos carnosus]CAF3623027.1 unnamed protein product [Didymodactylos carnosus]